MGRRQRIIFLVGIVLIVFLISKPLNAKPKKITNEVLDMRVEGIIISFDKDSVYFEVDGHPMMVPRSTLLSRYKPKVGCPVTAHVMDEQLIVLKKKDSSFKSIMPRKKK